MTVTATEPSGLSDSATFTWTIGEVNQPPTISRPSDRVTEQNQAVSMPLSGSDADNDNLTWSAVGLPDGLTINPSTGRITGTPTAIGVSTIIVTVSDGQSDAGATFDWQVIEPAVIDPDVIVEAVDDSVVVRSQDAVIIEVLGNDRYSETTTIIGVEQPDAGSVELLENNTILFTPPPGFNGELAFEYTLEDTETGISSTAAVEIVLVVALDDTVGAATGPVVEISAPVDSEPENVVEDALGEAGALIGDVVSIRLSRLQFSVLFIAVFVFLALRAFATRRRDTLVEITGVARDEGVAVVVDGAPLPLRHDAVLWIRGRRGRSSPNGRQVRVETPQGEGWIDAELIRDTGY